MKTLLVSLALVFGLHATAVAQVPNKLTVVEKVAAADAARFECAHTSRPCTYDFIKALACELHQADPRFGMNGRRGDPSPDRWSWDALNFCGGGPATDPTGKCPSALTIIDVIAGAGAPGARPIWQAFTSDQTPGAWIQPVCKPTPKPDPPPPAPKPKPYPGDRFFIEKIGALLEADYAEAGQVLNGGSATWFARPIWGYVNEGLTIEQAIARARKEWRAALGLRE